MKGIPSVGDLLIWEPDGVAAPGYERAWIVNDIGVIDGVLSMSYTWVANSGLRGDTFRYPRADSTEAALMLFQPAPLSAWERLKPSYEQLEALIERGAIGGLGEKELAA